MADIESSFIRKTTYDRYLIEREQEDSITDGSLHNLMLLLAPNAAALEAAILPIHIKETEPADIGGRILYLAALDVDLNPAHLTTFIMQEGMVVNISSALGMQTANASSPLIISEAYLRAYGNGLGEDMPELSIHQELPELAAV